MMKRFGVFGLGLAVLSILSSLAASPASATCRRISRPESMKKEGNFSESTCSTEVAKLTGAWVKVEGRIRPTSGNSWCVKIELPVADREREDGVFKNEGIQCEHELGTAELNRSDFTEVILPTGVLVPLEGGKFPVTFEGTDGKGKLETVSKKTVTCTKGKNSGEFKNETAGTLKLTFEGCESSGLKCTSSGAGAGEIKSEGTTEIVADSQTAEGGAAALLLTLSPETEFACTALVKVKVKGNILVLITPVNSETASLEFRLKQKEGKPEDNKYWNAENEERKPKLETSTNGGVFEESADESEANKTTTSQMIEAVS